MAVTSMSRSTTRKPQRVSFAKLREPLEVPNLLALQTDSFDWLVGGPAWRARQTEPTPSGLDEILDEISPIEDFSGNLSLSFSDPRFDEVKANEEECRDKDMTYSAPLFVTAEFMNGETGEIKSQTVFMGDFPMMTSKGTFIINGTERVVVSPARPLPGRLLRQEPGQDRRQGRLLGQGHPVPRCLARVRHRQARHHRRAHRPQAPPAGHRAAEGPGLGRRADPGAFLLVAGAAGDPGEGPHRRPGRGAAGHLPQAAPGRAADQGERAGPAGQPVLQGQALRPGQGRPVQGQQEAGRQQADQRRHADRGRPAGHRRVPAAPAPGRRGVDASHGRAACRSRPTTSTTSATAGCAPSAS